LDQPRATAPFSGRRRGIVSVFLPALAPISILKLCVISAGVLGTSARDSILQRGLGQARLPAGILRGFSRRMPCTFSQGAILLVALLYGFILWRDRRVPNDHPL